MEYHVITFIKRNGDCGSALISNEFLARDPLEDFFPFGTTEIEDRGIVEIIGDTNYLVDKYEEE